jgi:putative peptidoglycan lipid II flippase
MTNVSTKNVAKYSAIISGILITSKVIGFVREMLTATQFGASIESDIFKTATRIPNLFYSCVAAALVTSFIPTFASFKNDKKKAHLFFNNIFNILFIICVCLSIIGIALTPDITKLFVSGFKENELIETYKMTRLTMPAIIFLSLSGLQVGFLQSYGTFLPPALTSIVSSIIMIIGILLISKFGTIAAVMGFFLGSVAQVIFQKPFMKGYKYKFYVNIKDENVKKMLLLSVPILLGTAVSQVNVIVDSRFASNLAPGSISIIDYASKVSTIINQVFIVSITTILYPMLTEKYSNDDKKDFHDLIIRSINMVVIIAIPLICGMFVLSTPLVKILLEHGKFSSNDTLTTSICLKYLSLGALGYSLIDILGKVFYSAKDTVTPMINGIITVGLNILLIVILVPRLGVNGLAISTTVSATIIAVVMFIELKIKMKHIDFSKSILTILKATISGIIMAALVGIVHNFLGIFLAEDNNLILFIKLVIDTVVGILVYSTMLLVLKVEEFQDMILKKLKNKIKRNIKGV